MSSKTEILAWHFCGEALRDGRPIPPDGEWLTHEGDVVPCASGLHASERLIDALEYAPGSLLCRVVVRGDIQKHNKDKIVGRERKILWRIEAKEILREFARMCAIDCLDKWNAPDVVVQYLKTGDESLRSAAEAAAWAAWAAAEAAAEAAARSAAWAAARSAARAAARSAARAAARSAAWAAERSAAEAAAEAAAWAAAESAARSAARSAAWAAAESAARSAAESAARSAARSAQNDRLETMAVAKHEGA